jgi:GH43 family beta-xylosidase
MSSKVLLCAILFMPLPFFLPAWGPAQTFSNVLLPRGADPWVYRHLDGMHYLTVTTSRDITLWRSTTLSTIGSGEKKTVWTPPSSGPNSRHLWAPELHYLQNKWYLYYAADDGNNDHHRMFVLENASPDPFQGAFVDRGKIFDPRADKWAIDGTVFELDGKLYFVWSGREGDKNDRQNLYIAAMENPYTIRGPRVEICRPTLPWEMKGKPHVNEGPEVVIRGKTINLIYSASGAWTDDYCLGLLTATVGSDLLSPSSWMKHPEPIFRSGNGVFGPGHASFVKSPDGKEDWIVYHAALFQGAKWKRNVRTQRFTWNANGTPSLGAPLPPDQPIKLPGGEPLAPKAIFRSPVSLAVPLGGSSVWVAEYAARAVTEVDPVAGKVKRRLPLDLAPTGFALDARRNVLYVTGEAPRGRILALDLHTGRVRASLSAGHTPMAPVLSPDGKLLYVLSRFENCVRVLDVANGREVGQLPVPREPVAAALTPDGNLLVVANHLPAMPAHLEQVAAAVTLIDTAARKVLTHVLLPNGSTSLRGVCVAPDGRHAYITHTLGHHQLPATQLERGWMNTSALSILDLASRRLVTTVLLDELDRGAANAWDVICSADGAWLNVAHAGTHEVSAINRSALHARLEALPPDELADVPRALIFLAGIRQRLPLPGKGPRALAVLGRDIIAAQYFTDDLAVLRREKAGFSPAQTIPLGPHAPLTSQRRGELLFHDATLCFQHWQSCATCHPDGRADGLNWDLLNDGIGNPKNTRSMVYAFRIQPVMSLGQRATAAAAVRSGLTHIEFCVRSEEEAAAMDAYLQSLRPVPSPRLVNGRLSAEAERGRILFTITGCAACHPPPLYTDLKAYDLGTSKGLDRGKALVTPRLVEVWRTAPYLHDGSALTVQEAMLRHSRAAAALSRRDIDDLAEYVLSLP